MFPMLLDDQSLVTEFQVFIEAIDNSHELSLAGHQQYPGVYALFFLKSRRARFIGLRLAGNMGKLRRPTDLEPLQPLLKKCIGLLETEVLPLAVETSRPRVQLERTTVWLGIKALLGFLEPPAFEEGILERYPIFLSIVLNHISDDSGEFSYAVNCLRLLFEMLGCKLWLRATLSPSVMRNTLLGQCFHTRNEKSHKEIFDLFQPFLQSLEALQDGEHEKQRRHFIYFLLHQVPFSSNFSILMRKKACQIALLIIHRGYKMIPPCPPFECAHMWGPSLVSSLKDSSLHSSLRQPAFDLIQTIIVSDAAILASSILNCHTPPSISKSMSSEFNDEDEDEGFLFTHDVEEKDDSCWNAFSVQSRITSQEFGEWMCIPMLWIDVLLEIDPLVLPVSFSKAVLWALSRLSMVEPENSTEIALPARDWLSTHASEISHLYGWYVPSGSDDGGDGKDSKNSIKVSKMCVPLIKTFKRLTAHFAVKMEQGELRKQWTWEPKMSESLILLLVDPNDNARQVGRSILEQVSNTRGLACGLQFLCSCSSSLSAVLFGLKHASKLVQLDSVLLKFQTLHHFFFVLCKLLREGVMSSPTLPGSSSNELNISKVSSQGGFLRQPLFDSLRKNVDVHLVSVDLSAWEEFNHLLAGITWPFIQKCLEEGKTYMDYKISQMTCIRLLELLPVVFEKLVPSFLKASGKILDNSTDCTWLNHLTNWGRSSLAVIVRYWKQTLMSVLGLLKQSYSDVSIRANIGAIEKLIACETVAMDELINHVAHLSVALSEGSSYIAKDTNLKSDSLVFEDLPFSRKFLSQDAKPTSLENADVQILDSVSSLNNLNIDTIIVLSDDETQMEVPANKAIVSHERASQCVLDGKTEASEGVSQDARATVNVSTNDTKLIADFQRADGPNCAALVSQKLNSDMLRGKRDPGYLTKSKALDSNSQDRTSKLSAHGSSPFQGKSDLKNSSGATLGAKSMDQVCINKDLETRDTVIKQLVCDAEDDPWESSVKNSRGQQSCAIKPSTSGPKRQVIQLNMGMENRSGNLHRLEGGVKRFKPPALDDWYRPILEIDYFATVGLAPASEEENESLRKLKEVPVSFQSPDEYVDILRPLVLEEFKAQLHSCFLEMSSSEEMCCGTLSVLSVERIDDFHLVRCIHDDSDSAGSRSFSEHDLILLTRQLLKVSSHDVHMVGKVERHQKDYKRRSSILVIRFYLQNGSSRLNRARKLLIDRSKWHVARIMSITSQLREFQALSSINGIPLLPIILNPINHSFGHHESRKGDLSRLPQPLQRVLKSSYNDCQLQAIGAAIEPLDSKKEYDLSLIQGPPGTGKTRTILAIVSALLAYYLQRRNDMKIPPNGSLKPIHNPFSNLKSRISQSAAIARAWQDAALARQLDEDVEKSSKSVGSCTRGRVLICAQSNAAVDELVSRISSDGLYGSDGAKYKPFLVRVGNAKTVHPNSLPFFIDTLVDHKLAEERINAGDAKSETVLNSSMALRANLEKLVDRIRFYETKRANLRDGNSNSKIMLKGEASKGNDGKEMSDAEIDGKLRKLYAEKKAIYRDLSSAQAKEKKANDEIKALKHKFRRSILREAEIVVTTLSGCGGDLYGVCSESLSSHKFSNPSEHALFDAVVIDEAAQALEPATLIPLQLLKSKGATCIMVGDPKQLPATVLSNVASKYLYQCSMFERLQRAGHPVIMLTEQYRMHPEICRFPSLHFYDRKLVNGDQMSDKSASFHATEGLGPYLFFDVVDGHELHGKNSGGLSLYNESEADAAVEILSFFKKRYPSEFRGGRIGIITPYKSQLSLLRSRFSSAFGPSVTAEMEFNTVDGFQGREVDILVLSTVRAAEACSAATKINSSNIGFVADVRRMNVSLTRARLSLWVLGNARTLQTNYNWAALVRNAKERNLVVSVKKPYEFLFKSAFKKLPALENSSNCSKQLKHDGKIKEPGSHAGSNQKAGDETDERKKRHIGSGARSDLRRAGAEDNLSLSKGSIKTKKRARDEHDVAVKKDPLPVAVASSEGSGSKSMQSAIPGKGGTAEQSRGRGKGTQSPNLTEGKGKFENQTSNIDQSDDGKSVEIELLKPIVSKGLAKSDKHSRKQRKMEALIPSSVRTVQGRDGNDGGRASNQANTPKDAIAKRKQQRDDVDALLSSALISSKKTETSLRSLPVKRPGSPKSRAGGGIKPPKPRKVSSSSSAMEGQSQQHHRKRDKSLSSQEFG
ncbi:uncharacterized protein LOC131336079 isoform X2 [Rhododendron vialii]|nr:uncharacterized protein LOC131336079 isoform X2 [Rhododendron vialii]